MPEGVKSHDHLSKAELDRELNDALQGTFPASDPVAIGDATSTEPTAPSAASQRCSTKNWPMS